MYFYLLQESFTFIPTSFLLSKQLEFFSQAIISNSFLTIYMSNRMEVDQEGFNELCAEILENWMHPNDSEQYAQTIAKQNPFSLHNQNHLLQVQTAHEPHHIREDRSDSTLEIIVNEDDFVLSLDLNKMEENRIMKAGDSDKVGNQKRTSEKSSRCEMEEEINNSSTEESIIPILVMDTFYDRVLRRASDGIDIEALKRVDNTTGYDKASANLKMGMNENSAGVSTDRKNINLNQKSSQLKVRVMPIDFYGCIFIKSIVYVAHLGFIC